MMNNDKQNTSIWNNEELSFSRLALALAGDYEMLFVVNIEDNSYVEYVASGKEKKLVISDRGDDFFEDTIVNSRAQVVTEDLDAFLRAFRKENILEALKDGRSFSISYRLRRGSETPYFFLKSIRGTGADSQYIIMGVQNIDEQRRRELAAEEQRRTYLNIAQSLASLFEVIYYIDIKTNSFTEYSASDSYSKLGLVSSGEDFFEAAKRDISAYIYPDDTRMVMSQMEKSALLEQLNKNGSVSITYRQQLDDRIQYVNLFAFRQQFEPDHIVLAVRNVDAQIRREQEIASESETFDEIIRALAHRYEVIYYVNTENNTYKEYTSSEKYAHLKIGTTGEDFFAETQENMKHDIFPEDLPMMAREMEKDYLLNSLKSTGSYTINYRLILDGTPQYVSLFAIRPKEHSHHIIVAVVNVDAATRKEIAYREALGNAMFMANRDALTGVKNKHAYVQAEIDMDQLISKCINPVFAIVVCDVNGLKQVNDTQGHNAGDEYIKDACQIICKLFKRSPVFRVGGDEFAVILKGLDYEERESLIRKLDEIVTENKEKNLVTIAHGISDFEPDKDLRMQDVFERADQAMYAHKKKFKGEQQNGSEPKKRFLNLMGRS